jgi:hypothetical protein
MKWGDLNEHHLRHRPLIWVNKQSTSNISL